MRHRVVRSVPALIASLCICLATAACRGQVAPTPRYVYLPTAEVVFVTSSPGASSSRTPSASRTRAGGVAPTGDVANLPCSANTTNKGFFSEAAAAMSWDVYCAVLPGGWKVEIGVYAADSGGVLGISYSGPGGAALTLNEGAYCTTGPADCSAHDTVIGPAAFGNLVGTLNTSAGGYALYVNPGTRRAYSLVGSGLSEMSFRSIASNLHKVPKP